MGVRDPTAPRSFPQLVIAAEHYPRIFRTVENKIPVRLQMDVDNRFYDEDLDAFNIIGEIPGSTLGDEVVIVGAHFDSWHTGTGATDDATGVAVISSKPMIPFISKLLSAAVTLTLSSLVAAVSRKKAPLFRPNFRFL